MNIRKQQNYSVDSLRCVLKCELQCTRWLCATDLHHVMKICVNPYGELSYYHSIIISYGMRTLTRYCRMHYKIGVTCVYNGHML